MLPTHNNALKLKLRDLARFKLAKKKASLLVIKDHHN